MSNIILVMSAGIKDHLRSLITLVICLAVVFICAIGVAAIFISQVVLPEMNMVNPDRYALESHFSLILYTTSIISIGIYANVFAFQSLTKEKSRGNVQALLATPLKSGDIWLGKSLAVFLPGLVFAWLMTLAALLAVNYIYFIPKVGFIVNPWMISSNFIGVPLIYLALTLLVHIISLAGKPATGNVVAQVFLPVMIAGIINLVIRNVLSAGSWFFTVIMLSIALVIGIIILTVRPKLIVERIILSQ